MTLVQLAKSNMKKYGEGGQNAALKVVSGEPLVGMQQLFCAETRRSQGGVTSHHHVEVPGALLDGCAAGSYAASVLFCNCAFVASPLMWTSR